MVKVSVIIPMYNVERYVGDCLESVLSQSLEDIEVVVVDDASSDGSRAIVETFAARDDRVKVVTHEENLGRHHARLSGVAAATGAFGIFLDSDDVFSDSLVLERLVADVEADPADILRYGLVAHAVEGTTDASARGFQRWSNVDCPTLSGKEVAYRVFAERGGYEICWHVDHRLFRMDVLKSAFSVMTTSRLERAEDAYEYFVTSYYAAIERTNCAIMGYGYRMGAGITSVAGLSVERFAKEVADTRECYEAAAAFADFVDDDDYRTYARGLKHKLIETCANEWNRRVAEDDKEEAAQRFSQIVGSDEVAYEMWRFVRDRAYQLYDEGLEAAEDGELRTLKAIAESFEPLEGTEGAVLRARGMRKVAYGHIADLDSAHRLSERSKVDDVRIFVTTHKRVDAPKALTLQPVQVGWHEGAPRFKTTFHDDEGENISHLNPMYCELTTQYWAWKNVHVDYVGFCHYRRYFNFSDEQFEENGFGEIIDDYIDDEACKLYALDDERIRRAVKGFDVITTPVQTIAEMPGEATTPREQFAAAPYLHDEDLERVAAITKELHPDYAADVDAFLDGGSSCFCNMFIMRWEIFDAYCTWLFEILEKFCAQWDTTALSREALRTPGHLAERLFNIYYLHALNSGVDWRIKELQCVHFERPDHIFDLEPAGYRGTRVLDRPTIPVVFASDDAYVPMLTTTILSMLENASKDCFYDVVVFERNISWQHQDDMRAFFARFENASLRFYDVKHLTSGHDLATNNAHISLETYYRFLIQEAFADYDKVLYLDSDLIIQGDVAELFATDVEGKLIAAARDIDFLGNLNMPDHIRITYARDVLKLAKPYDYFQAGVLVLNTAEMRKLHSVGEWLKIATSVDFLYDDQDILNVECQGRVSYLEPRWNVMHDCDGRVGRIFSFAPAAAYDAYLASRSDPKVIHYAGFEKPWTNPNCDFAATYWSYARRMPFYEQLVARIAAAQIPPAPVIEVDAMHQHEKAVSEESPLRRVIDPIAPYGTARREVLKSIGRALQGKK